MPLTAAAATGGASGASVDASPGGAPLAWRCACSHDALDHLGLRAVRLDSQLAAEATQFVYTLPFEARTMVAGAATWRRLAASLFFSATNGRSSRSLAVYCAAGCSGASGKRRLHVEIFIAQLFLLALRCFLLQLAVRLAAIVQARQNLAMRAP